MVCTHSFAISVARLACTAPVTNTPAGILISSFPFCSATDTKLSTTNSFIRRSTLLLRTGKDVPK